MSPSTNYQINFFKPASDFMRANIKLITVILVFWAVAVFGFHGVMKAIETPTPEPAYIAYQDAWPGVVDGNATANQKIALARTCLTLTGKYIDLRGDMAIAGLFSGLVLDLMPDADRAAVIATARSVATDKSVDVSGIVRVLGLADAPLLARMVPYTLVDPTDFQLTAAMQDRIRSAMDTHLIHYQSVMTDTTVLGFPFHYFYTAVLLMIIFCLLCLVYCARIDKVMVHYGLEGNETGGQLS